MSEAAPRGYPDDSIFVSPDPRGLEQKFFGRIGNDSHTIIILLLSPNGDSNVDPYFLGGLPLRSTPPPPPRGFRSTAASIVSF